jgi:hypothetical protein
MSFKRSGLALPPATSIFEAIAKSSKERCNNNTKLLLLSIQSSKLRACLRPSIVCSTLTVNIPLQIFPITFVERWHQREEENNVCSSETVGGCVLC